MTEIKLIRDDDKTTAILAAVAQIDAGAELAPIVRCRDCLYFRALDGCPMAESGYFKNGRLIPHDTDFCSYGERENDEQ